MHPLNIAPMTGPDQDRELARLLAPLAEQVRGASRVLVLTGAGVSVASGLQTYRGSERSLYANPEALKAAFGSTIRKDPVGFWARFHPRRAQLQKAEPNPAHLALVELAPLVPRLCLATQNVDGLHQRAGSEEVIELHGNGLWERCLDGACSQPRWRAPENSEGVPTCPTCGKTARPDVVLFGEGADERWAPLRAFVAAGVDVVLLVGTSGVVPVPTEVCRLARSQGTVWIAELNPRPTEDTELTRWIDLQVPLAAEAALPALVEAFQC